MKLIRKKVTTFNGMLMLSNFSTHFLLQKTNTYENSLDLSEIKPRRLAIYLGLNTKIQIEI